MIRKVLQKSWTIKAVRFSTQKELEEAATAANEAYHKMAHQFYATKSLDIDNYRKQLVWRSGNLGMLEMDYLIGKYAQTRLTDLSYTELEKYESDVLTIETPDLNKLVMMKEDEFGAYKFDDDNYLNDVRKFVQERPWIEK